MSKRRVVEMMMLAAKKLPPLQPPPPEENDSDRQTGRSDHESHMPRRTSRRISAPRKTARGTRAKRISELNRIETRELAEKVKRELEKGEDPVGLSQLLSRVQTTNLLRRDMCFRIDEVIRQQRPWRDYRSALTFARLLEWYLYTSFKNKKSMAAFYVQEDDATLRRRVRPFLQDDGSWLAQTYALLKEPRPESHRKPQVSKLRTKRRKHQTAPAGRSQQTKPDRTQQAKPDMVQSGTVVIDLTGGEDDEPANITKGELNRIKAELSAGDAEEKRDIKAVEMAMPAVVHIVLLAKQDNPCTGWNEIGCGSGFLWDTEGHLVTNRHCIIADECLFSGPQPLLCRDSAISYKVMVQFEHDAEQHESHVLGKCDDKSDLAVLKIGRTYRDLPPPVVVGSSHNLKRQQKIHVLGGPEELAFSSTMGTIGHLDRNFYGSGTPVKCFQLVAPGSYPGNSGGPVIDSSGRVVGVLTGTKTNAQCLHFAIPIDSVRRFVSQVIRAEQEHGTAALIEQPYEVTRRSDSPSVELLRYADGLSKCREHNAAKC